MYLLLYKCDLVHWNFGNRQTDRQTDRHYDYSNPPLCLSRRGLIILEVLNRETNCMHIYKHTYMYMHRETWRCRQLLDTDTHLYLTYHILNLAGCNVSLKSIPTVEEILPPAAN